MSSVKNTSRLGASKASITKSVGVSQMSTKTKPITSSSDFSKHLKGLQQRAEENVEDEYITNLQQQIAYMELELKLLKEKEIEAKESVSQIDKFFNDGVPLNENILALKNQYNHFKKNAEIKKDELRDKRKIELQIAKDIRAALEKTKTRMVEVEKEFEENDKMFVKHMGELRMALVNEKHRRQDFEKELRATEVLFKKKTDENLKMARELERESLLLDHKKEKMATFRTKTQKDLEDKDIRIKGLLEELRELKEKHTLNPEIKFLEVENKDLGAKISRCEKDIFSAQIRIKEMQEILKERSKEREREAENKRTLEAKINALKSRIDEENRVNDSIIENKVKKKEDKEMKEIEDRIKDINREKLVVKQRLKEKEDAMDQMSQNKVGLQQETIVAEKEYARLEKEIKDKKERVIELKNKREAYTKLVEDLTTNLKPITEEIEKMRIENPKTKKHNEETENKIKALEQLQNLAIEIKNVNIEELKILQQSNDEIQRTISDLTKKWHRFQEDAQINMQPSEHLKEADLQEEL